MGTIPAGSGDDTSSGGFSDDLSFSAISLNGDCGSYFDGSSVICTIDKTEYKVSFSIMAQISKSDFGVFYGVVPADGATNGIARLTHSGAANRPPVYILPAVYLMPKKVENSNNNVVAVAVKMVIIISLLVKVV